jgi:hypothetical protein
MKRYLVFAAPTYYPEGGWGDFDSDHDSLESAEAKRKSIHTRFWFSHIVDLETGKIVIGQYETHEPKYFSDSPDTTP